MIDNKETHYSFSDIEFCKQLRTCTLNPKLFNHEAHLRLGWVLINNLGLEKAEKVIEKQLLNYCRHYEVDDKYSKTITIVSMRLIARFMNQSKTINFEEFIAENSSLLTNFKDLIMEYYSYNIFESKEAQTIFKEPDLKPF